MTPLHQPCYLKRWLRLLLSKALKMLDWSSVRLINGLGDRLKKQTNRESIAQKTAEYLSAGDPIDPETKAPDEEWLNLFGEYAEKASTDKLRNMWARVLAGEIRKPGVFSYRTIQFVSTLDAKVAQTLEEIAPLICNSDMILYPKRFDFTDNFRKFQLLIECGLVGTPIVRRVTLAEDFQIFMVFGNTAGILATCSSNLPYDLPYAPLTTIGREIYELLQPVTSIEDLRLIGIELHGSGKFKNVQLQILNVESSGAIQIKSQETVV